MMYPGSVTFSVQRLTGPVNRRSRDPCILFFQVRRYRSNDLIVRQVMPNANVVLNWLESDLEIRAGKQCFFGKIRFFGMPYFSEKPYCFLWRVASKKNILLKRWLSA